ncbi:hypothetical protein Psesu_0307 [Pseudoxanthomonas suwonensis 11-1]|uniref:DUF1453 domain-containing protein n=1 Tax=Pseudoxanthomonas suwonensis (strain 11-1) TaxID=743721 RepID=E6WPZ1_PSEUU|nr:hypothetical protein [Pseudoxanthomonas suwonensis]ADV26169.1 hypothetical protein Psesu_0307 [Pseudoxanthomonas suwonensis 11-1]
MPILLALAAVLALFLGLLPVALALRIRGAFNTRRQAWVLPLRLAWWSSLLSAALFALTVLLAGFFWPNVWTYVPLAALAGAVLGLLATTRVRFVETTEGLFYRTSPVVSVGLMVLVVVRLVAGVVQCFRVAFGDATWPESGWLSHAGMMAVGGLLLGYALVMTRYLYARTAAYRRDGGVLGRR